MPAWESAGHLRVHGFDSSYTDGMLSRRDHCQEQLIRRVVHVQEHVSAQPGSGPQRGLLARTGAASGG
jgi:hypothetical protein